MERPLWEREAVGSSPATPTDANINQVGIAGLSSSRLVVSAKSSAAYVNGRPAGICLMRPRFDSGMQG